MIIDRVENFADYPLGRAWEKAFAFLATLSPESEDRRYEIEGDDIFALVMSYETLAPERGLFESHEKYVDIQTVIVGAERFECAFREELSIETPYSAQTDAQFYKRHKPGQSCVDVRPGTFVMLYPHDAHLAGLMVDGVSRVVKKVVVKVRRELLEARH